jgi:alkyldihydroxyacetonephosphate synthase
MDEPPSDRPRFDGRRIAVDDTVRARLESACTTVTTQPDALVDASRDWWPLAMTWARDGEIRALASAVAQPASVDEVAGVLRVCNEARIPVTVAAGRSGVSGGSVPLHGGLVLDLRLLTGIVDVDEVSLVLDVRAGMFGAALEDALRTEHRATLGHWPQSIELSTVGGWLACRSAGQLSTRYGKIEDMVIGLGAVLADGSIIATGGAPRAAVGPDLTQVLVGSEGTLGVITGARLRLHPVPAVTRTAAYGFASFPEGLAACRRIVHRGARPAVVRLYDAIESDRHFSTGDRTHVLLILDEGEPAIVDGGMAIVYEECATAARLDPALVDRWLEHRNDVSALGKFIDAGFVVDTFEIAARWRDLPTLTDDVLAAVRAVDGTIVCSVHQSHSYGDGACLYFTFGGQPPVEMRDDYYYSVYDAAIRAALARGAALSHHHGVGVNRARFMGDALGPAVGVLSAIKQALDPNGILNPGKLGLPDPFAA